MIFSFFAGLAGLEPVAFRVTGGCSNQLSYNPYFQQTGVSGAVKKW